MNYPDGEMAPKIDASARIAPNAIISGDVSIGPNCSVGFGAVIIAESGPVSIGAHVVVMDTAVIRGVRSNPVVVGNNVLIGPRAYLSGCRIESDAFLATGATIFNGAVIGARSEIRINGIVHLRTVLPPETVVPIGWIAVGEPMGIFPPNANDDIWKAQEPLGFPKYVFGMDRPPEGTSIMPDVMPKYAALLRRRHKEDE